MEMFIILIFLEDGGVIDDKFEKEVVSEDGKQGFVDIMEG